MDVDVALALAAKFPFSLIALFFLGLSGVLLGQGRTKEAKSTAVVGLLALALTPFLTL